MIYFLEAFVVDAVQFHSRFVSYMEYLAPCYLTWFDDSNSVLVLLSGKRGTSSGILLNVCCPLAAAQRISVWTDRSARPQSKLQDLRHLIAPPPEKTGAPEKTGGLVYEDESDSFFSSRYTLYTSKNMCPTQNSVDHIAFLIPHFPQKDWGPSRWSRCSCHLIRQLWRFIMLS